MTPFPLVARFACIAAAALAFASPPAFATPDCTALGFNNFAQAKSNKLYLYFPASDDSSYPEFGAVGLTTSPAQRFDVTKLSSYAGSAAALQDAIVDVVTDDFCEFNVEVIATTTAPPTTFARRNTVAIGADTAVDIDGNAAHGLAQNPDIADQTPVDFARVWAGTYQVTGGGPGGALHGANSTLARWGRSIGGSTAHEAAHNYGVRHSDGLIVGAGEDPLPHHLMAPGNMYSDEDRAGYRRHFSDREYSLLASNVGLSVQTMFTWTFANPNAETGVRLTLDFLSVQSSLTLASVYSGSATPWINPTLTPLGPFRFRGVTYNRYLITWSTGQAWANGPPGKVPGGVSFSVGASFNAVDPATPDPIIVTDATLSDSAGSSLALHPRVAGFDAGSASTLDGSFSISATRFQDTALVIEAFDFKFLPRPASIDAMLLGNKGLFDPFRTAITPLGQRKVVLNDASLRKDRETRLRIAMLRDKRHIFEVVDAAACARGDIRSSGRDTQGCKTGINVSLFPATSTLVTVTLVDPAAKQWDRQREKYVVAPLRTTVAYQFAGRHIDLNGNGIDDYIEIASGRAKDRNLDGVVDDARRER